MALRNTPESYGLVHKTIHWVTALLVLMLIPVGLYMVQMPFEEGKLELYLLHKSLGLTVLFLAVARLGWRFSNPRVQDMPTHKSWEKTLAHIVHFLIYAALIVMPLSGWLMSSAGDFPAPFFGLFEMPDLIPKNETVFNFLRDFHEIFAFVILGVVALHAAGAFKHHFIDRDATLQRMTSRKVGLISGGVLALVTGFLLINPVRYELLYGAGKTAAAETQAKPVAGDFPTAKKAPFPHQWVIDLDNSSVNFEATQYGEVFSGNFKISGATIVFNPADLASAKAIVSIDTASINTGSEDRDAQARGAEWFDIAQFPNAIFETESFTETGPNQYTAKAKLTIRGVSVPVDLPFSLKIIDGENGTKTAQMEGAITLNRLDFGIGQGQWQSPETIGNAVKITVKTVATQNFNNPE